MVVRSSLAMPPIQRCCWVRRHLSFVASSLVEMVAAAGYFPGHNVCGCAVLPISFSLLLLCIGNFHTYRVSFSVYRTRRWKRTRMGGWLGVYPDSNPRILHTWPFVQHPAMRRETMTKSSTTTTARRQRHIQNNQLKRHFVRRYDVLQPVWPPALCLRLAEDIRRRI